MSPTQISSILTKLKKLYPEAKCALEHRNPFELLIATILSAQCTDKRVNMVTPALFQAAPTPAAMLQLGEKGLKKYIQTCGLYQSKAKNILATCQILEEQYAGRVPQKLEELVQLPGVGRKTANVVLSNAFDIPAIAVDTHVFRVSQRLGLAKASTPEKVEQQLMQVLPKRRWSEAHHLFIHHGRALCSARNPKCEICPLQKLCLYYPSKSS
ncbi:MAG: endonuclease III [Deltaproteobacteria bacterium]|nr:endonuclease III [Deltaproteobacteria bacterium]